MDMIYQEPYATYIPSKELQDESYTDMINHEGVWDRLPLLESLEKSESSYQELSLEIPVPFVNHFTQYSNRIFDSSNFGNFLIDPEFLAISYHASYHLHNSQIAEFQATSDIIPFNTNPNLAIYLNSGLLNTRLVDLANHEDRWYRFSVPANRKVSIVLDYNEGIYDLLLFRLNPATFALNLVEYSIEGRGRERINYLSSNDGIYFLLVSPWIPAPVPQLFSFRVDIISHFDAFELNGTRATATRFTDEMSIQANLDNPYDEDWFRLAISTAGRRNITVSNAPAGHYGVFIFNSSGQIIGSFWADGGTRSLSVTAGHYYIQIISVTGHVVPANYILTVVNSSYASLNNQLVIRGVPAQLEGQYRSNNMPVLGFRTSGEILIFNGNTIIGHRGLQMFGPIRGIYHNNTVGVYLTNTAIHTFDSRLWPMSWFFTTLPRAGADNHTAVYAVRVFVSINTGRVVASEPILRLSDIQVNP